MAADQHGAAGPARGGLHRRPVDRRHAREPDRRRSQEATKLMTARDRPRTGAASIAPARPRAARRAARRGSRSTGWGFVAPNLLLLALFLFMPLVWAVVLSLPGDASGFGTPTWVGLDNYVQLFTDPVFWQSLRQHRRLHHRHGADRAWPSGSGSPCCSTRCCPAAASAARSSSCRWSSPGVASGMIAVAIFYQ